MELLKPVIFFIAGAVFGSFANVLIYRIPEKLSIISPPSFCPECKKRINWYDNIPLISYVVLKGRCRYCKSKIPFRYFAVEIITAAFFCFAYLSSHAVEEAIVKSFLFFYLIVVSFIDLEKRIIPDKINYGFLMLSIVLISIFSFKGLILTPLVGAKGIFPSLSGILLISTFFLLIDWFSYRFFKKPGIGMGDLKFGINIGIYTGYYSIAVPFIAYAIAALFIPFFTKRFKDGYIPFGPFLAISTFLVVSYGTEMLRWYLNLVGLLPQP